MTFGSGERFDLFPSASLHLSDGPFSLRNASVKGYVRRFVCHAFVPSLQLLLLIRICDNLPLLAVYPPLFVLSTHVSLVLSTHVSLVLSTHVSLANFLFFSRLTGCMKSNITKRFLRAAFSTIQFNWQSF